MRTFHNKILLEGILDTDGNSRLGHSKKGSF